MTYETLILLFFLFFVISSIINRLQVRRQSQELEEKDFPEPVYRPEKDEVDLSEWEVFPEVDPPRAEPAEQAFQEVQDARPVTETSALATSAPEPEGTAEDQGFISPVRRRRKKYLNFRRNTVRKAILYNEILGPHRADRMPW